MTYIGERRQVKHNLFSRRKKMTTVKNLLKFVEKFCWNLVIIVKFLTLRLVKMPEIVVHHHQNQCQLLRRHQMTMLLLLDYNKTRFVISLIHTIGKGNNNIQSSFGSFEIRSHLPLIISFLPLNISYNEPIF